MSDYVQASTLRHDTPAAARPSTVQELSEGERLVLWAFRRWVCGPEHLPMLAREFDRQFRRSDSQPALRCLDTAMTVLSRHARRTIVYHQPCCACLGNDEVCFLSIVAAAQAGANHAARAMAAWLVRSEGVDAFLRPLETFADHLDSSGHNIPYRTAPRAAGEHAPAPLALVMH
jgi:hypothetical protein